MSQEAAEMLIKYEGQMRTGIRHGGMKAPFPYWIQISIMLQHWDSSGDTILETAEGISNGSVIVHVENGWWLRIGMKGYHDWMFTKASFTLDYLTIE
jgi:hypothetical protein